MPLQIDVQNLLNQTPIKKVFHFQTISSTNVWAKDFVKTNSLFANESSIAAETPFLIVADEQTTGRGRDDHRWFSSNGSLTATIVATWASLNLSRRQSSALSSRIAEAVCRTSLRFLDSDSDFIRIKLPNDVYVGDKKLAGILIESPNPRIVVIGIGVNLNNDLAALPSDIRNRSTSLRDLSGSPIDFSAFLTTLIQAVFEPNVEKGDR